MATKYEDSIEILHDYNVFVPTRTILLHGEINEDITKEFMRNLIALDSTLGEITVQLTSEGGEVELGFAIYDAIKNCKNRVVGRVFGSASSIATIILQGFDHRVMMQHSYLMLHRISIGLDLDTIDVAENWIKKSREANSVMLSIYHEKMKKNSRITARKLNSMLSNDLILSPEEALEWNLIDEIIVK